MAERAKKKRASRGVTVSFNYPSIGPALRAIRLGQRRTIQQVAKAAGLSVSTVRRAESDNANPMTPNLYRILQAMGTELTLQPVPPPTESRDQT